MSPEIQKTNITCTRYMMLIKTDLKKHHDYNRTTVNKIREIALCSKKFLKIKLIYGRHYER